MRFGDVFSRHAVSGTHTGWHRAQELKLLHVEGSKAAATDVAAAAPANKLAVAGGASTAAATAVDTPADGSSALAAAAAALDAARMRMRDVLGRAGGGEEGGVVAGQHMPAVDAQLIKRLRAWADDADDAPGAQAETLQLVADRLTVCA